MIQIIIKKKDDRFVSYEINGHASSGTGEFEFDVVCADVSVLSITTANNFERMAQFTPITQMDDGYLYVEIPSDLSDEQQEMAQILFQAFVYAITEVIEEFPDYTNITFTS